MSDSVAPRRATALRSGGGDDSAGDPRRMSQLMCICVYIYIYIYIHTYTYVYIYIYAYIHIYVYHVLSTVYVCMYLSLSLSLYIYIYIYTQMSQFELFELMILLKVDNEFPVARVCACVRAPRARLRTEIVPAFRGNHLSSTTCLTHVFFRNGKQIFKLW